MKDKIIPAIAVLALILGAWAVFGPKQNSLGTATTATGPYIENYIPAIMYSNGYTSAKDISTTANLNAAVGTFSSSIVQSTTNAATTTASLGCIQTTATSTATPIRLSPLATTTGTGFNGATNNGIITWQYGTCPI